MSDIYAQTGRPTAATVTEFHPRRYEAQLAHLRQVWPQGPLAPAIMGGATSKMAFTRWSSTLEGKPFEISSEVDVLEHVITLPMRRSHVFHSIGSNTTYDGDVIPGNIFLSGPTTQRSRAIYRTAFDTFRIYLSDALILEAIEGISGRLPPSEVHLFGPHPDDDKTLRNLTFSALAICDDDGSAGLTCLESIGLVLATHLVGRYHGAYRGASGQAVSPLPAWRLRRVIDYIESVVSQDISLGELSAVAGLTRMHFAAQFRAATGLSPHHYITQRKIEAARLLLSDPGLSVTQVAFATGFKSSAHFGRAFRRVVGTSPGLWRRSILSV